MVEDPVMMDMQLSLPCWEWKPSKNRASSFPVNHDSFRDHNDNRRRWIIWQPHRDIFLHSQVKIRKDRSRLLLRCLSEWLSSIVGHQVHPRSCGFYSQHQDPQRRRAQWWCLRDSTVHLPHRKHTPQSSVRFIDRKGTSFFQYRYPIITVWINLQYRTFASKTTLLKVKSRRSTIRLWKYFVTLFK